MSRLELNPTWATTSFWFIWARVHVCNHGLICKRLQVKFLHFMTWGDSIYWRYQRIRMESRSKSFDQESKGSLCVRHNKAISLELQQVTESGKWNLRQTTTTTREVINPVNIYMKPCGLLIWEVCVCVCVWAWDPAQINRERRAGSPFCTILVKWFLNNYLRSKEWFNVRWTLTWWKNSRQLDDRIRSF